VTRNFSSFDILLCMKKIFTALSIVSLFVATSVFAGQTSAQVRPGWSTPLAQVGPSGESVRPIRDIIREDNTLLRTELRQALATGGDVRAVLQAGITRLINDLRTFFS
jgi:hypothetical protein